MQKSILVVLAEGNEESEVIVPVDILIRAKISVVLASINDLEVTSSHGIKIIAHKNIRECSEKDFDAILWPGGMPGTLNILNSKKVISLVSQFHNSKKIVSAICAAPRVLSAAGILKDKEFTCFPGAKEFINDGKHSTKNIIIDDNIVTGKAMGVATQFGLTLVEKIIDKKTSEKVSHMIHFSSSND